MTNSEAIKSDAMKDERSSQRYDRLMKTLPFVQFCFNNFLNTDDKQLGSSVAVDNYAKRRNTIYLRVRFIESL
jgi:hypothetical protein